jgi:acyl-CoA synthetase (AMP-forming)/AMP-acid ligase II
MAYIVRDCGSRVVLFHESLARKVEGFREEIDAVTVPLGSIPALDTTRPPATPDDAPPDLSVVEPLDEAVIIYTSGTTGNPKGVRLSHLNLLADARAIADWFRFDRDTRSLCILPLFHNNGQVVTLLAPLTAGGSVTIAQGQVALPTFWSLVRNYGATWTSVMPAILSILLRFSREEEPTPLQGIICGGQVLNRSVQDSFESTFGVPVFEGFGLTETTSFACFNEYPAERRVPGTVGRPLPTNDMAILDDEGRELGPNEEGEICIRGLNVAIGYLGLPEANAKSFRDGWFRSGDYGYRDEDGRFRFLCRHDALIIKGGENVYPAEVENVLFDHPAVVDCAVVGVPDPLLGEDIAAFVKLKDGDGTTARDLREFTRGKLAGFKQPRSIFLLSELEDLDEIPKGPTKKVLYRKLVDYYVDRLAE